MLSHECLRHSSVSGDLKPLSEPVYGASFEIIQVCLAEVALISEERVHSGVEVATENYTIGLTKTEGYFNVLRSLIESVEVVISSNIWVMSDKL